MFSKKYLLPVAFISMAAIIGCGDDSSSGASATDLPESVKSLQEAISLPCNEALKCKKVHVENRSDFMECDGSAWKIVSPTQPSAVCAADPTAIPVATSSSSEAAPAETESSSSEAAPAEGDSSSSEAAPAEGDSSSSEAAPAEGDSSSSDAAPAEGDSSSSEAAPAEGDSAASEADAQAGGDMVSCDVPGAMGECLEFAAGTAEAQQLTDSCVSTLQGTLGTGCPK